MTERWKEGFSGLEKMGRVIYGFECKQCKGKIIRFEKGNLHEEPGCGVDPNTQVPYLLDDTWHYWPKRRPSSAEAASKMRLRCRSSSR